MADKRSKDDPPLILNPARQAEKRINRVLRFRWCQRRKRAWISFLEITEWHTERSGRFDAGHRAYDMLQRDLLDGDFGEGGRWLVLYLNPHVPEETRMTRAFLHKIRPTSSKCPTVAATMPARGAANGGTLSRIAVFNRKSGPRHENSQGCWGKRHRDANPNPNNRCTEIVRSATTTLFLPLAQRKLIAAPNF